MAAVASRVNKRGAVMSPLYTKTDRNASINTENVRKEREYYARRLQELMERAPLDKIIIVYAFAQGVVK